MNTQIKPATLDWYFSEEAYQAIEIGEQHHLSFRIVGGGELPSEPVHLENWWYETLESLTNIPSEGLERLVLLKKAAWLFQGHEKG